jgi:hypothetical protein
MQRLGNFTEQMLIAADDRERRATATLPSRRVASRVPEAVPFLDRRTDLEIPRRLISFRETGGKIELRRAMTAEERRAVEQRAADLEGALAPWSEGARPYLQECLGVMFAGFRSRRDGEADAEISVDITLSALRSFPAWAIARASSDIQQGKTKLDKKYAPHDVEIVGVCNTIVASHRRHLLAARDLLKAVAPPEPDRTALPGQTTPEDWLRNRAGKPVEPVLTAEQAKERDEANEALRRSYVLQCYRRLGLSPPQERPDKALVTPELLLTMGWKIEEINGKRTLVAPYWEQARHVLLERP